MVIMNYIKVSKDRFENMQETIEVLGNQKIMKQIKKSLDEIKKGKFVTLEGLKHDIYDNYPRKH